MAHEPSITFLGATRNVTGSRFLVHADTAKVLVDCGLYQERDFAARNWEPFPVEPASIDAVLLTHAHLDHCGYLPRLVRDGFQGPIYCTPPTAEIAQIVLEDSARIQMEDARAAVDLFEPVPYGEMIKLGRQVSASFHDAGHILGSALIRLVIGRGSEARTVLFSGDLGREATPLLRNPHLHDAADYVVIESTYGDRTHPPRPEVAGEMARVINQTAERGGSVLIPSFAIERAQDLLFELKNLVEQRLIPPLKFFVDSPMATDVTRVFEGHAELLDPALSQMLAEGDSPFRFPGLTFVRTSDDSKAINHMPGTVVVIAGAGMCNGGRIKHHLANRISDPRSTVLFVGYQAKGTLGRTIVDGATNVRILGQDHEIHARVEIIQSLSAHADRVGLAGWLDALKHPPRKVFVVHGDESIVLDFAEHFRTDRELDAEAPQYGQQVTLT